MGQSSEMILIVIKGVNNLYTILKKFIYHTSALLFAIATLIAFIQVIFRYVFNASLSWAEESVRYMFIWMFFLGMAEATRTGLHVTLDVIFNNMTVKTKRIAMSLIDAAIIVLLGFMSYYGFKLAFVNMSQMSPAMQIPMGYIYLAIPVGSVFMIIFYIYNIMNRFTKEYKGEHIC